MYPNLFKSRYPTLNGRDWINRIDPEDKRAFVEIGLVATDHGKLGGDALVKKYGKKHMRNIARVGAIVTNIRKEWRKAVELETLRIQEEAHDINN
jgi:hypothetical protein